MPSVAFTEVIPNYEIELIREWSPLAEPKAIIVLIHGIAEHSGRYEHVGDAFADGGFMVRSFDLIGAGASGGPRWDIDDWSTYHDQIQRHVEWARTKNVPVVLMGHSMGGNLALGYALSERPHLDLLILSTPAIGAKAAWQKVAVPVLARIAPRISIATPVNTEELSSDPGVGEAYLADPLVILKATPRFGNQFLQSMKELQASFGDLDVPTLVTHGGSDSLVPPQVSAPLADLDCVTRKLYPGLRHETMNEPEGPQVIADMISWLEERI